VLLCLCLLQFGGDSATWRVIEHTTIEWQRGASPYEILVEESVPPSRDEDSDHRIRVRVPGRPDFIVLDNRGSNAFVPVREALSHSVPGTIPPNISDSTRILLTTAPNGASGPPVLLAFGFGYASDPTELAVIGLDVTGYPVLLFRGGMTVVAITDLDHDGRAELVGRPVMPQSIEKCRASYAPLAVLRFASTPGTKLQYDETLSRSYNAAHYVWGGPNASDRLEVETCATNRPRLIRRR
jgi:hypothetical protein